MSQDLQIIRAKTVEKLRKEAKALKKSNKIPHNEALDIAARRFNFNNWAHLKTSTKTYEASERAYNQGLVIALDIKDAIEDPPRTNLLIKDDLVLAFIYMGHADATGEIKPEDQDFIDDLQSNYFLYRYVGEIPDDIFDAIEITSQYTFFGPTFIWFKGGFFDSSGAIYSDGEEDFDVTF